MVRRSHLTTSPEPSRGRRGYVGRCSRGRGHGIRRRESLDEVAERYDRARPGYPLALVDDLVDLACLGRGSRVLEIGCGTGQLTVPLAERGVSLVGVELGANLAAIARRKL